eukprot:GFUD01028585.1.p1 GENE.GFUD01028585.1~~GFUD01028585.1.p1  ORF type:complete len:274 (+),score=136.09 GFUD01028585.1:57-878(+)
MSSGSSNSSSEEEGLTCLLDVVGGGGMAVKEASTKAAAVMNEKIDDEKILKLRNFVQQIHLEEGAKEEVVPKKDDPMKVENVWEQVDVLKREICDLLVEREKLCCKVGEKKSGREDELRRELAESRQKVEGAKVAREQLRELYSERIKNKVTTGRVASKEEFNRLREDYFRSVVQAGQLEERLGELKQEVVAANTSVARLQKELQAATGGWQGQQGNPWQVGVPYGSKAGRAVSGERDRYGRPVGRERGGQYGRAGSGERGPVNREGGGSRQR